MYGDVEERERSRKQAKDLRELRRLVRDFITATECVPFRAVDCDQDTVFELIRQLREKSGLKKKS